MKIRQFVLIGACLMSWSGLGAQSASSPSAATAWAQALEAMAQKSPIVPMTVAFGNFTFGYSGVGNYLSRWFENRLQAAIPQTRSMRLLARSTVQNLDPAFAAAYQDIFDGAAPHGVLFGTWFDEGPGLRLNLVLTSLNSGEMIDTADIRINKSELPPASAFAPPELTEHERIVAALTTARTTPAAPAATTARPSAAPAASPVPSQSARDANNFGLAVTTDRGTGAVYLDGENLTINLKVERDAYIALYHVDVAGNIQRIFPVGIYTNNYVRAGQLLQYPGPQTPGLQFRLGAPYGREYIKAIASSQPFDFRLTLGQAVPLEQARQMPELQASGDRAESLVWYTISGR